MEPRRRINLLPAEVGEKNRQRQAWVYAIIGLGVLVGILAVITLLRAAQAKSVANDANRQEQKVKELEAKARELEYLDDLQSTFKRQKEVVQSVWVNEVSWAKVLQEIAAMMPDGVYLTSFDGSVDPQAVTQAPIPKDVGGPGGGGGTQSQKPGTAGPKAGQLTDKTVIGIVKINGNARSHRHVGNWLYRVNRGMPSLTYAWINSQNLQLSAAGGGGAADDSIVSFQSTTYATPYAWGWMGRCAARGFDNLADTPVGSCGHSYYGTSGGGTPSRPTGSGGSR